MMSSYVYLITNSKAVKIGIANDPEKRLSGLQTSHYEPLRICCTFRCADRASAAQLESLLHKRYASDRLRGEWFSLNPNAIVDDVLSEPSLRMFVASYHIHKIKVSAVVGAFVNKKKKLIYDSIARQQRVNSFIALGIALVTVLLISLAGLISAAIPMYFMALLLVIAAGIVMSLTITLVKEIYEIMTGAS